LTYTPDYDYEGEYVPEVIEGQWYWTAVPIDYQFPAVQYEILEELFLSEDVTEEDTEEDEVLAADAEQQGDSALATARMSQSTFWEQLEEASLKMTGNWVEEEQNLAAQFRRRKVRPRGRIRVWNTEINDWDGVEGIKVRTNRWFKWGSGWTRADGSYSINKRYRRNIRYSLKFVNRSGFRIWKSMAAIATAKYNRGGWHNRRKYSRDGWNLNIATNSVAWRLATVNNATVHYLEHCETFDVSKPHKHLRIAALNEMPVGGGSAPMLRRTWGLYGFTGHNKLLNFFYKFNKLSLKANALATLTKFIQPDILVGAKFKAGSRGTGEVYEVMFHELAHASHMKQVGSDYWVKYINYIITYGAYGNGRGKNAGICGVGEMWAYFFEAVCMQEEFGGSINDHLTPDYDWFNPGFLLEVQRRTGDVSVEEIFDCLQKDVKSFDALINELKTKTTNDDDVDEAFANYTDWP